MEIDDSLRFDKATRDTLIDGMVKAMNDVSAEIDIEFEARCFIGYLELGAQLQKYYNNQEKQQRRREQLEAFANALDKVVDAALMMDDPALAHAIWCGFNEMTKLPRFTDVDREEVRAMKGWPAIKFAYQLQKIDSDLFRSFALGVRKSIKDLPRLDDSVYSFEYMTAWGIIDYLDRFGVVASTSDTGFAGKAFLAVMDLAGVTVSSAKYWLEKAKKNGMPNSMRL